MTFETDPLIYRYIAAIEVMEHCRGSDFYSFLDKKRRELHEEILVKYGATREDEEFTRRLAIHVEKTLGYSC